MEMLLYNRLDTAPVQRQFDKTINYLQQGDFRSADVRKMKSNGFYRARLDDTNRLLFKIGEYDGRKYIFILEVILNHDYDKSRFLRGAAVQEEKLTPIYGINAVPDEDIMDIAYLNPRSRHFTILDKCITLSEEQSEILYHEPPMLLLGAAGSGKTVLALEKIRNTKGHILYVTLSHGLVQKAHLIYNKDQAPFAEQKVTYCSLDQFLRLFLVPKDREATYQDFKLWFERIRSTVRIKDSHKLFEEIRGVLTGALTEQGCIGQKEYEQLGVRQSVFPVAERTEVYNIFTRYTAWLKTEGLYDPNIFAHLAHEHILPMFDMVVVDEVQDFTTMQLSAVLKSLKHPTQFLLCGDANQVVHPNFFSWTSVKRLLHQRGLSRDVIRLLPDNHRNDVNIVKLANKVLALKNVRFGSIDRESNNAIIDGKDLTEGDEAAIQFNEDNDVVLSELNQYYCASPQVAVIVLREEDKAAAKTKFQTPLVFSVHEAKGLEFNFVILYNFISNSCEQFASICEGVAPRDINGALQYKRPKDKEDRSLQAYQFYINSLYVAITRAITGIIFLEREPGHRLLSLLGVRKLRKKLNKNTLMPVSSMDNWQRIAIDLEKYGRKEQTEAIRAKLGNAVPVPWPVIGLREYRLVRDMQLMQKKDKNARPSFNNRDMNKLYQHLLFYPDTLGMLAVFGYSKNRLTQLWTESRNFLKKLLMPFKADSPQRIEPLIKKYGPNYRNEIGLTPLMLAAMAGATNIAKYLMMAGADPTLSDNWGRTAFGLAIAQAHKDEIFAEQKLLEIAQVVIPPFINLKTDEHTLGLFNSNYQFYIVTIIIALQLELYHSHRSKEHVAIHIDDMLNIMKYLTPDDKRGKWDKKEYLSSFLSDHEASKMKKILFMKMRKSYYILWWSFELLCGEEWMSFDNLTDINMLFLLKTESGFEALISDIHEFNERIHHNYESDIEKEIMAEEDSITASLPDDNLRDWPA